MARHRRPARLCQQDRQADDERGEGDDGRKPAQDTACTPGAGLPAQVPAAVGAGLGWRYLPDRSPQAQPPGFTAPGFPAGSP